MVFVFFWCRIGIYPWFFHVHSMATQVTFMEAVMKTPPRCATWLILALILQLHWFKIMLFGALKVVREKFQTNSNSAPNTNDNRTPNNNHEETMSPSEYVVAKDIIKNHHKAD